MSTQERKIVTVRGKDENGTRLTSKIFEEEVRGAAAAADELILESYGQHNIGLRLGTENHPVDHPGQRSRRSASWLYGTARSNNYL